MRVLSREEKNMSMLLGLVMFICLVPFVIIMYFLQYPKNWQDKKIIFGVRNRAAFSTKENEETVDEIVQRIRKQATCILIPICVLATAMVFIPSFMVKMIGYTVYIFIALMVMTLPYVKGNSELKSFKRELGLASNENVRAADLKSISSSHTLNMPALIIPNVIMFLGTIFALLYDLKIISVGNNIFQETFAASISAGVFLFQGILFIFIAKMTDDMRNEVISKESDVNANYNRAKKKIWSDFWLQACWLNSGLGVLLIISIIVAFGEIGMVAGMVLWLLILIVLMANVAQKTSKLKEHYKTENEFEEDDDDYWVYGLFYYNPKDARLNVEKRVGIGSTINMAHPMGKVISGIIALVIIGTFGALVYAGIFATTPLDTRVEDGKVICHQFRDEYKIAIDDIQSVKYVDTLEGLSLIKLGGAATDKLYKGNFAAGDDKNIKVYLSYDADCYIRIQTSDEIYYINDVTKEDTKKLYDQLSE